MEYKTQRITLRIPSELHKKLSLEADNASRSMNAEIISRLNSSFTSPEISYEQLLKDIEKIISKKK